jgi:predicted RNA-binding protein associated with RNAse of E/G family
LADLLIFECALPLRPTKSARFVLVSGHLHAQMLDGSSVFRLDYPLDIVDTRARDVACVICLNLMAGGAVMCAFLIDLVDLDQLTEAKRKTLLKNLQRERKAVQSQLNQVSQTLKELDRSIKVAERKSKRRG